MENQGHWRDPGYIRLTVVDVHRDFKTETDVVVCGCFPLHGCISDFSDNTWPENTVPNLPVRGDNASPDLEPVTQNLCQSGSFGVLPREKYLI